MCNVHACKANKLYESVDWKVIKPLSIFPKNIYVCRSKVDNITVNNKYAPIPCFMFNVY